MSGTVVIDTNLLVLLIVGSASKKYISIHKDLSDYTIDDFDLLGLLLAEFSDIVVLPHILAETANFVRRIKNPAHDDIQRVYAKFITTVTEVPLTSNLGTERDEFIELGLNDAVILHLCSLQDVGISPTLLTSDTPLANRAASLGYSVINYKEQFQLVL